MTAAARLPPPHDPLTALPGPQAATVSATDRALLNSAARTAQARQRPQWLALARAGQLPLIVRVTPAAGQRAAGIELHDPHRIEIDTAALRALFGLTAAEAGVATLLAAGWQPLQIAHRLGVQANTVAAHLKRTLAKTGAGRQAALVALLRSSAAACAVTPGLTQAEPP